MNFCTVRGKTDNSKTPVISQKAGFSGQKDGSGEMGRGGFEPPTHGFSVRCSTN